MKIYLLALFVLIYSNLYIKNFLKSSLQYIENKSLAHHVMICAKYMKNTLDK